MSPDKFFTTNDTEKITISGDDDLDDLKRNGKGLVIRSSGEETERPAYFSKRYFCTNCRQGIHNTPDNDNRCKRKGCECRCLTHYVGRDGRARPYGTPDDSFTKDETQKSNEETDKLIQEMNEKWHEMHGTKPKEKPEKERIL